LYEQALALFRQVGDKLGIALELNGLGVVAEYEGDYARAGLLCEEALVIFKQLGMEILIAMELESLGVVAQHQSDYRRAAMLFADGLALAQEIGFKQLIPMGLVGLAGVASAQDDLSLGSGERAARLLGAADALCETIEFHLPPRERAIYDRTVVALHAALDEATFAATWAEGRVMILEQAVGYALKETNSAL
jgi:tetratricopeptide (TPR) repeat protein